MSDIGGFRKAVCLPSLLMLLTTLVASWSHAAVYFSTDVPFTSGGVIFEERDTLKYEDSTVSVYLSGESMGIPRGIGVKPFAVSGAEVRFFVDAPCFLGSEHFTERDLIRFDGSNFSKLLDGSAIGIPEGAGLAAATQLVDGSVVFSLDVPATLGGTIYKPSDLIRRDGASFSLFLGGSSAGIPENAVIDAVHVSAAGEVLFSLDVPSTLGGIQAGESDVVKLSAGDLSLHFDGSAAGLPPGCGVGAVFSSVDPSLIATYGLEESGGTVTDTSGNGNHGTVNGAFFSETGGLLDSNAYQFNWSTGDNIQIPYRSSQTAVKALSLEAWIRPTAWDNPAFGLNRIVSKQPIYLLRGAGGAAQFVVLTANHGHQAVMDTQVMPLNRWHHVVGTFDGQSLQLYVDGAPVASLGLAQADTLVTNEADLFIGESPQLSEGFTGTVDNVAIYGRALQAGEISETWFKLNDPDRDGLPSDVERAFGTDPGNPDTDGDDIPDGDEDSNRNGILDAEETDPRNADTDGDGFGDGVELAAGTNPRDPTQYPSAMRLRKGFNLVAIPSDVTTRPDLRDWLADLGGPTVIEKVMARDPATGAMVTLVPDDPSGPSFLLQGGEGLILYALQAKEVPFLLAACTGHDLTRGFNLVGMACPPSGYTAFQFLNGLGVENVVSIQRFDAATGAFETAGFGESGEPVGIDFPILRGEGYFVFMKQDVTGFQF